MTNESKPGTAKEARPAPTTAEMNKGAHGVFETVTVQGEDGPVRINKHDYDEEQHTLVDPPKRGSKSKSADMTKEEIQAELDKKKVEYGSHETKDELLKKLRSSK